MRMRPKRGNASGRLQARRGTTGKGNISLPSALHPKDTGVDSSAPNRTSKPPGTPDAEVMPESPKPQNTQMPSVDKPLIRIAVINPVHSSRAWVRALLEKSGSFLVVGAFSNAKSALLAIPRLNPEVVLVDPDLPDLPGPESTRRLRSLLPGLRVIIHSPHLDPATILLHIHAGARGYVCKDAPPEELCRVLRENGSDTIHLCSVVQEALGAAAKQTNLPEGQAAKSIAREQQVLELMALGLPDKETADKVGISEDGVGWHARKLFKRYSVHSRTALLAKLHELGKM